MGAQSSHYGECDCCSGQEDEEDEELGHFYPVYPHEQRRPCGCSVYSCNCMEFYLPEDEAIGPRNYPTFKYKVNSQTLFKLANAMSKLVQFFETMYSDDDRSYLKHRVKKHTSLMFHLILGKELSSSPKAKWTKTLMEESHSKLRKLQEDIQRIQKFAKSLMLTDLSILFPILPHVVLQLIISYMIGFEDEIKFVRHFEDEKLLEIENLVFMMYRSMRAVLVYGNPIPGKDDGCSSKSRPTTEEVHNEILNFSTIWSKLVILMNRNCEKYATQTNKIQ